MSYDYSENILVQESAGHLLERELGWEVAFAYNTEQLGKDGTFGRTSYREILLTRYFRQALQRLNPWLTSAQMDEAQKKMESRLSTASLMQINEEKYALIRDGIPVTVQRPGERPVSYGPDVSAREAVSSPPAPSASSAAASSSGRTQKATAPAAAQNTSSTVGLGMNNAQAAAQRDAAARATQVQKAESAQVSTDDVLKNTKMPSNIQEALRKMGQNGAK